MKRNMEVRLKDIQLDFNGEQRKIGGYINVTERESETLYSQKRNRWFKETMKKGVFTRALQKNDSIPLLLEHDWDKQLAHTANGTLELREDAIGLRFDAVVSEETFADIQARSISACSFGFRVNEEMLEEVNPKLEKRYVTNIDLFEVSLVANPAYTGSLVEQRNLEEALQEIEEVEEESKEVEEERAKEKSKEDKESKETESEKEDVKDEKESDTDETKDEESKEESKEKSEEEEESEKEKKKEQRAVDIDTTSSDVKEDAKEVIQDVIEQTQKEAEFYGDMASEIEEYKEEVKEVYANEIESLENESLHYTTMAYAKWLEVAKLKQINMNL